MEFGVYITGSSAGGAGMHIGSLEINSNVPGTNLQIPVQVNISEPNFALIAVPVELTATTEPMGSFSHSLYLRNSLCDTLNYHIEDCVCQQNTSVGTFANCTLTSAPWIKLEHCNGSIAEQGSATLSVDFMSPSASGGGCI